MIAVPVFVSRLPIGSSARTSGGIHHQRPGDGNSLHLSAGQLRRSVLRSITEVH